MGEKFLAGEKTMELRTQREKLKTCHKGSKIKREDGIYLYLGDFIPSFGTT